jgi:hypothetical protein
MLRSMHTSLRALPHARFGGGAAYCWGTFGFPVSLLEDTVGSTAIEHIRERDDSMNANDDGTTMVWICIIYQRHGGIMRRRKTPLENNTPIGSNPSASRTLVGRTTARICMRTVTGCRPETTDIPKLRLK